MKTIIKNPRVTEKASFIQEGNVYAFNVSTSANKKEIAEAVFTLYKVKPIKVNVLTVPLRRVSLRGRAGTKGGGKKALVYLKAGDKIEFI